MSIDKSSGGGDSRPDQPQRPEEWPFPGQRGDRPRPEPHPVDNRSPAELRREMYSYASPRAYVEAMERKARDAARRTEAPSRDGAGTRYGDEIRERYPSREQRRADYLENAARRRAERAERAERADAAGRGAADRTEAGEVLRKEIAALKADKAEQRAEIAGQKAEIAELKDGMAKILAKLGMIAWGRDRRNRKAENG